MEILQIYTNEKGRIWPGFGHRTCKNKQVSETIAVAPCLVWAVNPLKRWISNELVKTISSLISGHSPKHGAAMVTINSNVYLACSVI